MQHMIKRSSNQDLILQKIEHHQFNSVGGIMSLLSSSKGNAPNIPSVRENLKLSEVSNASKKSSRN